MPQIVSISILTNQHSRLNCLGLAGAAHRVQACTDLRTWTTIGTATAAANGAFQFEDASAPGFVARFYRLVVP